MQICRFNLPRATALLRSRAGHARPVFRPAPFGVASRCSSQQPLVSCRSAVSSIASAVQGDKLDAQPKGKAAATASEQKDSKMLDAPFWEHMRQLMDAGTEVPVHVQESNRGGLVVRLLSDPQPDIEQCRGFIPLSKCAAGLARDTAAVEAMVGTQLSAVIFNVKEADRSVLLREPAVEATAKFQVDPEAFRAIQLGHVCDGVVKSVKQYGIRMELGNGVVGLLRPNEISKELHRLSDHFRPGDMFKVLIMRKDEEQQRILLSTRKLEKTAGDVLRNRDRLAETAEEMAAAFRARLAARETKGKEASEE